MTIESRRLPDEVVAELRSLRHQEGRAWVRYVLALRRRGYTYAAIGAATGVSRQRVHQLVRAEAHQMVARGENPAEGYERDLRALPPAVEGNAPTAVRPAMNPSDVADLRAWWAASSARRGSTPVTDPSHRAHDRLVALVRSLLREGWSMEQIADATAVAPATFRARMGRAGLRVREARA